MTDYKIERRRSPQRDGDKPLRHGGAVDALRRGSDIIVQAVDPPSGTVIAGLEVAVAHARLGERIPPELYPVALAFGGGLALHSPRHGLIYADVVTKAARIALEAYPDEEEFSAVPPGGQEGAGEPDE
ncbi:MAG TPA: hypothetical protein VH092_23575 [Urbifossiella sp.]|jgi:hypothetical protein|nr:hypothetical protein [Urbifossiella sp.]